MDIARLPDCPAFEYDAPTESSAKQVRKRRLRRFAIDLLKLVGIVAVLLEFRNLRRNIDRPWLDRDVQHVYQQLKRRFDYRQLPQWCGLSQGAVTSEDRLILKKRLSGETAASEFPCSQFAETIADQLRRKSDVSHYRWIRLTDPNDARRWIGIAVIEMHGDAWIVCRVPIGFDE